MSGDNAIRIAAVKIFITRVESYISTMSEQIKNNNEYIAAMSIAEIEEFNSTVAMLLDLYDLRDRLYKRMLTLTGNYRG